MPRRKSEREEALWRILVAIVAGVVLYLWSWLIGFLTVINLLIALFLDKRNQDLAMFCEYWNTELYKYVRYLTGVSNVRPFPFNDVGRMSGFEK